MTREEAIKVLQREKDCVQQAIQSATEGGGYVSPDGLIRADDYVDACTVAISALRAQQTIHVTDLYDEDGGDVYRVQKASNDPLTMAELRQMDGEPIWVHFIGGAIIREDGWFVIAEIGTSEILIKGKVSVYKSLWYYGETWLAYRRKPEEGTK